jgi:integrase
MATGHLRKRIGTNGAVSYQLTAEGDRDPLTGKRERKYKTVKGTKKQAEAELRKMIADLENGSVITMSSLKLSSWMGTWLSTYLPNIEQTTRDGYQEKIDNYIIPALGHIPLKAIKTNDIQIWINGLIGRKLSPKTIRNAYNNLNAALEKAVVLRMIPYNPCKGTVLPKLQKYQAQVFNTTDIQQALAAADSLSIYLIILLGATVGLRRGEMAALQWKDINFSASTVSISQNRVHTKNSVVQKAPKSQAGNRTIKVGTDVITALSEAKAAYDDAVLNNPGFKNLGYVLCKENGDPFHPDSITQKWERFITRQQLPQIRLHDLRHSNATALIAAGVSAKVVQHRLGHANVSITLNTYTHVLPSMDEEAAEKLDNALFSSAQPINHPPITI